LSERCEHRIDDTFRPTLHGTHGSKRHVHEQHPAPIDAESLQLGREIADGRAHDATAAAHTGLYSPPCTAASPPVPSSGYCESSTRRERFRIFSTRFRST